MRKITIWERIKQVKQEDGTEIEFISHNHIEYNWVENNKPQPLNTNFELQKAWSGYKWKKTFAYINQDNRIIKDN